VEAPGERLSQLEASLGEVRAAEEAARDLTRQGARLNTPYTPYTPPIHPLYTPYTPPIHPLFTPYTPPI